MNLLHGDLKAEAHISKSQVFNKLLLANTTGVGTKSYLVYCGHGLRHLVLFIPSSGAPSRPLSHPQGGALWILCDGDDQMGAKIKTQIIPRAFNKTQKNLLTRKLTPPPPQKKVGNAKFASLKNFQKALI